MPCISVRDRSLCVGTDPLPEHEGVGECVTAGAGSDNGCQRSEYGTVSQAL
jgi:hypothetical protein